MKRQAEETVGQFTGLHDKNGRKIFEGDIIELVNADYETIQAVCEFGTARRQIFENVVDITGVYFKLPSGKKSFPMRCGDCKYWANGLREERPCNKTGAYPMRSEDYCSYGERRK